jgi:hypothetical protein
MQKLIRLRVIHVQLYKMIMTMMLMMTKMMRMIMLMMTYNVDIKVTMMFCYTYICSNLTQPYQSVCLQ